MSAPSHIADDSDVAVESQSLVRGFGGRPVGDGGSFTLRAGECLAVFGPHGVGSAALTEALTERRASGAALVVVTHNLGEGLALATHAAIMRRGRFARYEQRGGVDATSYVREYRELVTTDA